MDPDGFAAFLAGSWSRPQPLNESMAPQKRDEGEKTEEKKSPCEVVSE
jgi:hypothetical protein